MRTFTATGVVRPDHTLTVAVPSDIPPGPQTVVVVLGEATFTSQEEKNLQLEPHAVGLVDPERSFRREDMYGDGGR
jgi:hypothetical protein